MSTRACLAVASPEGWEGVYVHNDGNPTHLGKAIWRVLQERFISPTDVRTGFETPSPLEGARAFCEVCITGHPGGWSSFPDVCYCHDPAFVTRDGVRDHRLASGDWDASIEWVYVVDPTRLTLAVMQSFRQGGAPLETVATIDLLGPEPDWRRLESNRPPLLTQRS